VAGSFSALRILIVEDEYYLAADHADALRAQGEDVVGPVATVSEAAEAVERERIDCAILDMNLRGEMAYPIADRLEAGGIPFLITTGYNSASLPERFVNVPRVEKPFDPSEVSAAIPALLARA
jgi:DNA-binding response OmpR family regulator